MRSSRLRRKTRETDISIELTIEGKGEYDIKTPIGFLTHMIESFAKHGLFNIRLKAKGDIEVDDHHTIEDCGIALGQVFRKALGEKKGINRAGYFAFPMDEALAYVAVDIGGRPYLNFDEDEELYQDFLQGFCLGAGANIAVKIDGRSRHHKIEAIFKALGKAMKISCMVNKRAIGVPSTKGRI